MNHGARSFHFWLLDMCLLERGGRARYAGALPTTEREERPPTR
jgi:hypothetical protein